MNRTKYVRRICDRIQKRLAVSYRLLFLARFWGVGRRTEASILREIQRDIRELLSILPVSQRWLVEMHVTAAVVTGAYWTIAQTGKNPLPDWFVDKECLPSALRSAYGDYKLGKRRATNYLTRETADRQLTMDFEAEGGWQNA